MICSEDDEDAGDKKILVPLDLNSSKARGVGLFHSGLPTTDLQKMNNLPKYKKTLWNLETLSWSVYQCLVLISSVFMLFCCSCPCCCCCCRCCCYYYCFVVVVVVFVVVVAAAATFSLDPSPSTQYHFVLYQTKINTRPIRFLTPLSVVWLKGRMLPRMWQRKFESDQELRWQKQWVLFPGHGTKSVSKSMVSKKSNLGAQTASKAKLTLRTVEYTHFNHWWAKIFFRKVDNNWAKQSKVRAKTAYFAMGSRARDLCCQGNSIS